MDTQSSGGGDLASDSSSDYARSLSAAQPEPGSPPPPEEWLPPDSQSPPPPPPPPGAAWNIHGGVDVGVLVNGVAFTGFRGAAHPHCLQPLARRCLPVLVGRPASQCAAHVYGVATTPYKGVSDPPPAIDPCAACRVVVQVGLARRAHLRPMRTTAASGHALALLNPPGQLRRERR